METSSFWQYLAIVRKRLWLILLLFAATMVILLARAWSTPPTYRASMTLQVNPLEPEEVTLFARTNTLSTAEVNDLILFQFENVVSSTSVAQRALGATGVNMTPAELLSSIQADRDPSGERVTVSLAARTPEDAEKLVAAQVEQALTEFQLNRSRPAIASGKFLEAALADADRNLAAAKDELLKFKLTNNMESVSREINAEQDAIRALTGQREAANLEAQRLAAMADELERQSQEAAAKAAEAEASVRAAAAKNTEAPDAAVLAAFYRQTAQDTARAASNRRVDAAGQRQLSTGLTSLVSQHESNLTALITLGGQFQKLDDTVKEHQDTRDFLDGKVREARLKQSQSQNVGYLQVIGEPVTLGDRVATRTLEIALVGGVLSILAGIVLVFLLEFLEQTLRQAPRRSR